MKNPRYLSSEFMLLMAGMLQYREARSGWNNNGKITLRESDSKIISGPTGGVHRRARAGLERKGLIRSNQSGPGPCGVRYYYITFMPGGKGLPKTAEAVLSVVPQRTEHVHQRLSRQRTAAVPQRTTENEGSIA